MAGELGQTTTANPAPEGRTGQGVGGEVAQPPLIGVLHRHRRGHRVHPGQPPLPPAAIGRVLATQLAGVPLTPPDPATPVRPDPPGALVTGGRLHHLDATPPVIDTADVAAGQGAENTCPSGWW
jgi:hypothetical protein